MATKLGNGGHGQENYDPNTGKYVVDGVSNKYYDNPKEKTFQKIDWKKELEGEEISKFLNDFFPEKNNENNIVDNNSSSSIENNENWSKELPYTKIRFLNDNVKPLLKEKLKFGTKEAENILGTFIEQSSLKIRDCEKSRGEDTSCYNPGDKAFALRKVDLEKEIFDGELVFHELSHSLDDLFQQGSNGQQLSNTFVSEKYNMTMKQKLQNEFKTFYANKSFNKVVEEFKNEEANLEYEFLKTSGSQFNSLNEIYKELSRKANEFFTRDKIKEIRNELSFNSRTGRASATSIDKVSEKYIQGYKELKTLADNTFKQTRKKLGGKYSGISDCMSIYGTDLGWGHPKSYFQRNNNNHVAEFFANLGSSRFSTSPEGKQGYEMMKKHFPQTVEIFEEIIGKLNGKTNIEDMKKEFMGRMSYYNGY